MPPDRGIAQYVFGTKKKIHENGYNEMFEIPAAIVRFDMMAYYFLGYFIVRISFQYHYRYWKLMYMALWLFAFFRLTILVIDEKPM